MIRPDLLYLQLAVLIFHQVGFVSFFLVLRSMTADVCDLDEHRSGQRREGMLGAAIIWVQEMAVALSVLLSGSILVALDLIALAQSHPTRVCSAPSAAPASRVRPSPALLRSPSAHPRHA
jgi:Na+/melibiose symporter-like transporter